MGGIAQGGSQSFVEAGSDGKVAFRNKSLIQNSQEETIVMSRNMEVSIIDAQWVRGQVIGVSFGSKLLVADGEIIERGRKLFEWDPYTLPIIAETDGVARFLDLTLGVSLREDIDEATGIFTTHSV